MSCKALCNFVAMRLQLHRINLSHRFHHNADRHIGILLAMRWLGADWAAIGEGMCVVLCPHWRFLRCSWDAFGLW